MITRYPDRLTADIAAIKFRAGTLTAGVSHASIEGSHLEVECHLHRRMMLRQTDFDIPGDLAVEPERRDRLTRDLLGRAIGPSIPAAPAEEPPGTTA